MSTKAVCSIWFVLLLNSIYFDKLEDPSCENALVWQCNSIWLIRFDSELEEVYGVKVDGAQVGILGMASFLVQMQTLFNQFQKIYSVRIEKKKDWQ